MNFVAEDDLLFDPDDDFIMLDDEGLPDADSPVSGRRYLAMPTEGALADVLRLYRLCRRGRPLPRGFTPWRDVFARLKDLRPWGPQDRISDEAIALWRQEIAEAEIEEVRVEAELFFEASPAERARALDQVRAAANGVGGEIITSSTVEEIAYHAALVKLPVDGVQHLIDRDEIAFVLADQIMFIHPQSSIRGPVTEVRAPLGRAVPPLANPLALPPIAALLDGMPLQNHALLANRLSVDDPHGLEARAIVSERHHGTAMASLILHGDLHDEGDPLPRPLYVHPILYASGVGRREETNPDGLLVDTLYRAVVRMKDPLAPGGPTAPDVLIVNLSLGDRRRAFSGTMSPLGRLLDFLAHRYNLLFLVSAGNIASDVALPAFNTIAELEAIGPDRIARAFLEHIRDQQAHRTLLGPAESLNPLTIGAAHDDHVPAGHPHNNAVAPYQGDGYPNVSSALGLGHRRVIKPDLIFPGGKERLRFRSSRPLVLKHPDFAQGCGLYAAAPDPSGRGQLDRRTLICGTSAATALASRAAHQVFDSMMDVDGGSNLAEIDPVYWPVVVKALLVHAARWPGASQVIAEVFGPLDPNRNAERADNVARLIGYGLPDITRVMDCSPSQATLVGFGDITPAVAHEYHVPLPQCLEAVVEPRSVILTLAWLSPVSHAHQDYRRAQLLVDAPAHRQEVGVRRIVGRQPSDFASKRGSLIHEIYEGEEAVVFVHDGSLVLRVWCREKPSNLPLRSAIRYSLAITIEAGTPLPVYEQTDIRLRAVVEPGP